MHITVHDSIAGRAGAVLISTERNRLQTITYALSIPKVWLQLQHNLGIVLSLMEGYVVSCLPFTETSYIL